MIISEQIRAARMLLRWEQRELAEKSGVSLPTVKRLETKPGELAAHARTVDALRAALETAGVHFVESDDMGPGVRLKLKIDMKAKAEQALEMMAARKMTLLGEKKATERASRIMRKTLLAQPLKPPAAR